MELKENKGVIFKNEKKNADTHPDYKGQINVNGVVKDISLWMKTAESGKKYFSVSIQEPYKKEESKPDKEQIQDDTPGEDGLPW